MRCLDVSGGNSCGNEVAPCNDRYMLVTTSVLND